MHLGIEDSLTQLAKGKCQALQNCHLVEAFPQTIDELLHNGDTAQADNLLMQLALTLHQQQPGLALKAFRVLAATAEQLATVNQWPRLAQLVPALQQGLHQEGADAESSRAALIAISTFTAHALHLDDYATALELVVFQQTMATGMSGAAHLQEQAQACLLALCTTPLLKQLLDRYLKDGPDQEITGKLLLALGPQSARFQLQQLSESASRFDRNRLLNLIKQSGNPAVALLLEQLHNKRPWLLLRNAIRLLGDIGNPALFPQVRPFIQHHDPRVQQEVIATAIKIGGDQLQDFLLHALEQVDDSLKIQIVNHVTTAHDERFVGPLTELLESTRPFLVTNKNDLQLSLCITLGAIGSSRACAALDRVVQSKQVPGLSGYSDEVRRAAWEALAQIRQTTASGRASETKVAIAPLNSPAAVAHRANDPGQVRLLLRDVIDSQDSDASPHPVAARPEDLEIWTELTDRLGTVEFQAISRAFTERHCRPEETIVSQGDKNDALFFINQGSVKVSHLIGGRELFITSLSRGQLAGENFFTPSLWTVTLTALTPCRLSVLPQSVLACWQEQAPGLRARFYEYYRANNNIGILLKKKGLERRQDPRYTLARKIQVQPISNLDLPIGRGFRAETADISLGGMAFVVGIARQENARLLLGRRMQIILPVGGRIGHIQCKGLIIGAQPSQPRGNDFSVHLKFDHPIERQELQAILG